MLKAALRLLVEPAVSSFWSVVGLLQQFTLAGRWYQAIAIAGTAIIAWLFPIGLVVSGTVALAYHTGHPLVRTMWDVAMLLCLVEVVQWSIVPLIVLSVLSITDLVVDTAWKAREYAYA